jgi:hypothetical protein
LWENVTDPYQSVSFGKERTFMEFGPLSTTTGAYWIVDGGI